MNDKKTLKPMKDDKGFFECYASFSSTLRTWLVAYGIGVPVLLANSDFLVQQIQQSEHAQGIVGTFLGGVGIQVLAAFLYKYVMGYLYFGELNASFRETKRYRLSDWLSEAFLLEFIFDITTIGLFMAGSYLLLLEIFRG